MIGKTREFSIDELDLSSDTHNFEIIRVEDVPEHEAEAMSADIQNQKDARSAVQYRVRVASLKDSMVRFK